MTWNVQALPKSAQNLQEHKSLPKDYFGVGDGERLREKIVPRVVRIDPDIVVFQKAFRGNVGGWRDALLEHYPHAVLGIDERGRPANSGLMVFSKFPFVPFNTCMNGTGTLVDGINNGQEFGKGDCLVNTDMYNRHTDPGPTEVMYVDAYSAKAVAMVRVLTDWGCTANVAFTHTTASYGKDGYPRNVERQQARQNAFQAMADLIAGSLTPTQLANEPLFLVGDLNVDGSSGPDDDFFDLSDGKPTQHWITPLPVWSEWQLLFSQHPSNPTNPTNPTDFFACGTDGFAGAGSCPAGGRWMTDAWAFEHPITDNGATGCIARYDECGPYAQRLDYILHNHPVDPASGISYLCPSHLQRLWGDHQDLGPSHPQGHVAGWDTGRPYSDHLAVFGDFAFTRVSQCNPIEMDAPSPQPGPSFGSVPVTWPLEAGISALAACQQHSECGTDESCHKGMCGPTTCTTPQDCPSGVSCVSGECRQYCTTDADCSEQGTSCIGWCAEAVSQDVTFPVELSFPRRHVWFKIGEDNNDNGIPLDPKDIGTVSIGVLDGDEDELEIRVYQAEDLSWPVAAAHQDTVRIYDSIVQPYLLDKPPYYVRVSAREGTPSESFPLSTLVIFRKNQCTDPYSDVCLLTPGVPIRFGWPGPDKYNYAWDFAPNASNPGNLTGAVCAGPGPAANLQSPYHFDYAYFRFFVDAASRPTSTIDPDVQFAIANTESEQFDLLSTAPGLGIRIFDAGGVNPAANDPFNVKLCDCGDPLCPSGEPCNSPITWSGFPGFFGTGGTGYLLTDNDDNGVLAPSMSGTPRPFILRVHRTEGASEMSDMTIEMLSGMTLVKMVSLKALENDDEPSPRDEIRVFVRRDGDPLPSCDPINPWEVDFSQSMDEDDSLEDGFFSSQAFSIVSQPLQMRICEDDDGVTPDRHYGPDLTIYPLEYGEGDDSDDTPPWFRFCDTWPSCVDAEYLYELKYKRRHELMEGEDAGGDPVAPVCP